MVLMIFPINGIKHKVSQFINTTQTFTTKNEEQSFDEYTIQMGVFG